MKIAVSFAFVKHKTRFFGKNYTILQKKCDVSLIYSGIVGMCNRHSHTKKSTEIPKEIRQESVKMATEGLKKRIVSSQNLGLIMTVEPLAKIGVKEELNSASPRTF